MAEHNTSGAAAPYATALTIPLRSSSSLESLSASYSFSSMAEHNDSEAAATHVTVSTIPLPPVNMLEHLDLSDKPYIKGLVPDSDPKEFGDLGKLLPEIRKQIFGHVLNINSTLYNYSCGVDEPLHWRQPKKAFFDRTALLGVNRALYLEASPILWSENRFVLTATREGSREPLYSLELFGLKEDYASDPRDDPILWADEKHPGFCADDYEDFRVNWRTVPEESLVSIRYLILDISDRSSRGWGTSPTQQPPVSLPKQARAAVELLSRFKKLEFVKINIDLGSFSRNDTQIQAMEILEELSRLRIQTKSENIEIRATCDICLGDHEPDFPHSVNDETGLECIQVHGLTPEYTAHLKRLFKHPESDVVLPVFAGTHFVSILTPIVTEVEEVDESDWDAQFDDDSQEDEQSEEPEQDRFSRLCSRVSTAAYGFPPFSWISNSFSSTRLFTWVSARFFNSPLSCYLGLSQIQIVAPVVDDHLTHLVESGLLELWELPGYMEPEPEDYDATDGTLYAAGFDDDVQEEEEVDLAYKSWIHKPFELVENALWWYR